MTREDYAIPLWELPDVLLFRIVSFVAPATHRAHVLCQKIAPLCRDAYQSIVLDEEGSLWETVLKEDYGSVANSHEKGRRVCKRLRRTPIQRVRDAHFRIKENTEIAYFYLSEMCMASSKQNTLTLGKMRRLLEEYGPNLRINSPVKSGGLFLVEVCRARKVKESVIKACVQELVEHYGALVNQKTYESANSCQTALCVAAVRAMPSIVRYLLVQKKADCKLLSSGRFRLHTQPKKTVRCINVTPLEFAETMRKAERDAGATPRELVDLDKCIQMLSD